MSSAHCVLRTAYCVPRTAYRVLRTLYCVLRSAQYNVKGLMIVFIHLLLLFSEKEKRETELVVHSTDDVIFCDRSQHMNIRSLPTGLQFVKEIKVGSYCNTVCHYKGYTYVGLENGAIDRMNDKGNVTLALIKLVNPVIRILVPV